MLQSRKIHFRTLYDVVMRQFNKKGLKASGRRLPGFPPPPTQLRDRVLPSRQRRDLRQDAPGST